jgi:tetratricopeptide (TPR) repeat protein
MSARRRLVFALLVAVLVLGALEGVLRLAGLARDDALLSPLLFQQVRTTPHAEDAPGGWKVLHDGPMRRAEPRGLRVLVVGGSAADGVGVTPFGRFSHLLERHLVSTRPGHPVEVINLARAGLASRHVAPVLAGGLADLRPQAVIVYSGNNELHELRALKHSSPAYRANLEGLRRRLHGLHLYRMLQHLLGRDRLVPIDDGPLFSPGLPNLPTPAEQADRELARRLYREQLEGMIRTSRQAGARVLLATVADNRAAWPGFTDREPSDAERALLAELATAVAAGDPAGAERIIARLEAADPAQASIYEAGQAMLALRRVERARQLLDLAELRDARPTRSSSELRDTVRELAIREGTGLCDLAAGLDELAPGGVAGHEHFTDGCHLGAEGQQAVALMLADCVEAMGLWPGTRDPAPLVADPYRLDHDLRSDGQGFPAPATDDPPGLAEARAGHAAFALGRPELALEQYALALERGAPSGPVAVSRAIVHWQLGDPLRAGELLQAASDAMGPDREVDNLRGVLGL